MKNRFVALVAVALFATVFAAGCGKFTKCSDAKTDSDCKKEKFEENKFTCTWVPKDANNKDSKEGKCEDTWKAKPEAAAVCEAVNALPETEEAKRQSACDKATPEAEKLDANAKCSWTAEKKCAVVKK